MCVSSDVPVRKVQRYMSAVRMRLTMADLCEPLEHSCIWGLQSDAPHHAAQTLSPDLRSQTTLTYVTSLTDDRACQRLALPFSAQYTVLNHDFQIRPKKCRAWRQAHPRRTTALLAPIKPATVCTEALTGSNVGTSCFIHAEHTHTCLSQNRVGTL